MSMRVRFAPSPTGHLHIGGARTALFDWLMARRAGGTFILRIEDTDPERSKKVHEEQIIRDMKWLGLTWEEGPETGGPCGPYRQSERMSHYMPHIDALLASGRAYRCTCSKERIDSLRAEALEKKEKARYDGHCRDLALGPDCGPHVVRLSAPLDGSTVFKDLVKGSIEISHAELDDLILLRTDGSPTYNFVVVVDDMEMGVTHVVRGDDHVNNTPKQILIYQALDADIPEFGHLPMILGQDGGRLSKRHGATSVGVYREMGLLAEAMVNYLARLGWAHGDQEVFSIEELSAAFSLEAVGRSGARWDMDKLTWLNQVWMKRLGERELARRATPFFEAIGLTVDDRLPAVVGTLAPRSKTLVDMATSGRFYFTPDADLEIDPAAAKKFLKAAAGPLLAELADALAAVDDWAQEPLEAVVHALIERHGVTLGKVAQPVRVAITGAKVGPGLYEMLLAIGKTSTIARLRSAAAICPAPVES